MNIHELILFNNTFWTQSDFVLLHFLRILVTGYVTHLCSNYSSFKQQMLFARAFVVLFLI
jgi:hypothetical protein